MIFGTWRSYFISWQIFENKVWCPVSKKRRRYFHFLLSLAYPIDRLDWALFSVVILFHHFFPLLEKVEIRVFILPRNFPAVLIIFTGRGGEPPPPHSAGRGGEPPLPRGEGSPRDGAPIPGRRWLKPLKSRIKSEIGNMRSVLFATQGPVTLKKHSWFQNNDVTLLLLQAQCKALYF